MQDGLFRIAIQKIIKEFLFNWLPHTLTPNILYGVVTFVEKEEVNVKILTAEKEIDEAYSELPYVTTELELKEGDIVLIGLINGDLDTPYIIKKIKDKYDE